MRITQRVTYRVNRALAYFAAPLVMFGFAAAIATPVRAANAPVTMTVTAVGKHDADAPPLKKEDLQLYQGKERMQIADVRRGDSLFLAILIDDSLTH
jgi:hypothetical protein